LLGFLLNRNYRPPVDAENSEAYAMRIYVFSVEKYFEKTVTFGAKTEDFVS
jgi:hypothetical protein